MATGQDNSPKKRGAGSWIVRGLLLTIAGILVAVGLLIAVPPAGLIKDQIELAASAAAGRSVKIADADVSIWPSPSVSLNTVTVASSAGTTGSEVFKAQSINARLKLQPLFSGKAEIESLEIVKPEVSLATDASGKPNWLSDQTPAAGPEAATSPAMMLLTAAVVKDGSVSYSAAGSKEPVRFEKIDATFDPAGAFAGAGQLIRNGESAKVSFDLKDVLAMVAGKPSAVKASIDGKHVKGEIDGIASNGATQEFAGGVSVTSGSVPEMARWLGMDITKGTAPLAGSLAGKIKATASGILFEPADVVLGTDKAKLAGTLSLAGPRPKYEGTIAVPRIDLNAFLGKTGVAVKSAGPEAEEELELETAPAWDGLRAALKGLSTSPGAAPEAAAPSVASSKSSAAAWSETPIDLTMLQSADIDAVITSEQLVLGKLDLKNAEIKTKLSNGKLDAQLQKLAIGTGSATGTLSVDSSKAVPVANVALNLVNVAAEPIISEITGKPLLTGVSNVDITASGAGKNQNELASSIEGKATFRMSKGHIRGFDVRSIVSNWWNSLTGGLKFDINKQTGFEKLEAQYDIKKGVMTSSPGLDIGGSEVEVQSRGNVSLPAKRINQEIRVKVVPPPSAPPIPVKISGAWSKPSVSMDWGDLLFSSAPTALSAAPSMAREASGAAAARDASDSVANGFQELAPKPEEIPSDVTDEIKRVLASDAAAAITPEGRALLETLLPLAARPAPAQAEPPAGEKTQTAP